MHLDVISLGLMLVSVMFLMSVTPSVSMICLLLSTGLMVFSLFVSYKMKMGALILCLIVVGGLFVLLSFVVLSMPWDFSKTVESMGTSVLIWSSFGCYFWPVKPQNYLTSDPSIMVWKGYSIVFIFLITFLLFSLAIFHSMMKVSSGTSFSKS